MPIQQGFIRKNTKELRDKLIELGYDGENDFESMDLEYLYFNDYEDGYYNGVEWIKTGDTPNCYSITKDDVEEDDYGVDFGEDEEAFLNAASEMYKDIFHKGNIEEINENFSFNKK